ncbi:MAG: tyrosine-type recombinase/integrase [Acidimicrobiales bacterium]
MGAHLANRPHSPTDLVFTAPKGGPLQHRTFYRRYFRPAVAATGLPEALRFHDLRHTAAALLIAQGAHPRAIMERLGHSSTTITMNVYGHLFPNLDEALTRRPGGDVPAGRRGHSRREKFALLWCRCGAWLARRSALRGPHPPDQDFYGWAVEDSNL